MVITGVVAAIALSLPNKNNSFANQKLNDPNLKQSAAIDESFNKFNQVFQHSDLMNMMNATQATEEVPQSTTIPTVTQKLEANQINSNSSNTEAAPIANLNNDVLNVNVPKDSKILSKLLAVEPVHRCFLRK